MGVAYTSAQSVRSGELKFIPVKIADVFPQRAVHCAAVIYVKLIITASVGVYKLLNIRINFIHHQQQQIHLDLLAILCTLAVSSFAQNLLSELKALIRV